MTEKQYNIKEFLKATPGAHTAKSIAISCGSSICRANSFATYPLRQLVKAGKVNIVQLPCQPVRYQWNQNQIL